MTKQSLMTVALSTLFAVAAATSNESAAVGHAARSPSIRGSRNLQETPGSGVPAAAPVTVAAEMCSLENNNIPGFESDGGRVCCPLSCGTCGGADCGNLPGGAGCCVNAIVASSFFCSDTMTAPCIINETPDTTVPAPAPTVAADPTAAPMVVEEAPESTTTTMAPTSTEEAMCSTESNDIPGFESEGGSVCCLLSCGTCGGSGCGNLPGGAGCCVNAIVDSSLLCSDTMTAPCIINGTPDTTVPAPAPTEAADVTAAPTVSETPAIMTTMAPTATEQTAAPTGAEGPAMCSIEGEEIPGIESEGGSVCCSPECFTPDGVPTCGGSGCGALPGGDGCCSTRVQASNNFCSNSMAAPCIIRATTTTTTVP